MKKIFLGLSICAGAILLSSCGSSEFKGYEKNENGLYFKFYNQTEGAMHPKAEDEIFVKFNLKFKSNDSVLSDTKKMRPENGIINFVMRPSTFKGSLEEAIMMMSKGDSASFIISADSFYLKTQQMPQLPPALKPGDKIIAEVKLEDFRDAKIVQEERKKKQEEMMKQMQEMEMKSKGELEKYIADNKIAAKPTESGLYYIEMKKGKGPKVNPGDTVQCLYKGMLLDGTVFEDNSKAPKPIEFPVGIGALIAGWDEGIPMMNVGGKSRLICPFGIAYGPRGQPPVIPPFSTLVFEIEVVGVKPVKK